MNRRVAVSLIAALGGLLVSNIALAHHSYAIFDQSREVTMTLVVKKLDWANPHVWIRGLVMDNRGSETEWSVECRSPNELARQGLRSIDIKPGTTMTVAVNLARDGSKVATIIRATTADGKKFGRTKGEIDGAGQVPAAP
jgi:hypothetical protein